MNGAENDAPPMRKLARHVRLSCSGSISAPALNVSTTLPNDARNSNHCPLARCIVFPTTTPSTNSMMATDRPSSIDSMLAMTAATIRTIATNSDDASIRPPRHKRLLHEAGAISRLAVQTPPSGDVRAGSIAVPSVNCFPLTWSSSELRGRDRERIP
jgi:hypothetical protein